jgi:hypothetical protein
VAREAGAYGDRAIGRRRPELRKGGAHTGVADQHELPGPING